MTHVCWHRFVGEQGSNLYYECRCGSRRHGRRNIAGHTPLDKTWLGGGEWGGGKPTTTETDRAATSEEGNGDDPR